MEAKKGRPQLRRYAAGHEFSEFPMHSSQIVQPGFQRPDIFPKFRPAAAAAAKFARGSAPPQSRHRAEMHERR